MLKLKALSTSKGNEMVNGMKEWYLLNHHVSCDMVHGCMVYTELAPRWLQFHVAPAMPALKYTTSVDI